MAVQLRDEYYAINEEIKKLMKSKELVEKCLENIRKRIHLSHETQEIRGLRPFREKVKHIAFLQFFNCLKNYYYIQTSLHKKYLPEKYNILLLLLYFYILMMMMWFYITYSPF